MECGGHGYPRPHSHLRLLDLPTDRELILDKRPSSEIKKAARTKACFLRESAVEQVLRESRRPRDQQGDVRR